MARAQRGRAPAARSRGAGGAAALLGKEMIRNGHGALGGAERPVAGGRRDVRVWCDGW